MESIEKQKIKNYICNRRMVSVQNLCDYFNLDLKNINSIINELVNEKKVRTSLSHSSCSSSADSCQSCSSCGDTEDDMKKMIVISLKLTTIQEQ